MNPLLRALLVASPLWLAAACGQPASAPAAPPRAQNPGPPLTPSPMPPSYIGRWAASAELCADGALALTDKALTTAGDTSCAFSQVTPNETGWIAEGACTSQGQTAPASLVLNTTRTGSARTLAVSGGPFAGPQVLLACAAETAPLPPATTTDLVKSSNGLEEAAAADRRILDQSQAKAAATIKAQDFKLAPQAGKVWREVDQVIKLVEPLAGADGRKFGERAYYYRPGEPDPYLVQDMDVAYALTAGKLTTVFSREGAELQPRTPADAAQIETRVLTRARELRKAADAPQSSPARPRSGKVPQLGSRP